MIEQITTIGTDRQTLTAILERSQQRARQRLVELDAAITAHGPALLDDLRDAGFCAIVQAMDAALAALGGWLLVSPEEYSQLDEVQARYALVAARWRAQGLLAPVVLPRRVHGDTLDALLAQVQEIHYRVGHALHPWLDGQQFNDASAVEWLLRAVNGDPFAQYSHTYTETLSDQDAAQAARIALAMTGPLEEGVTHDV